MAILDQKHGLTLAKNVNFSTFWTSCFYSVERRFFVLEYHKRHFPALNCLKRKVGKMAIFRSKPWVNPLGKMTIFRLFELLVFIAWKGVFFFLEYGKRHFPFLNCLKKKLGKWPFLDQNHGLTPLEKCQFFGFLHWLFL